MPIVCRDNKIWNPDLKQCVKRYGQRGIEFLEKYPDEEPQVECDRNEIQSGYRKM